MAQLDASLAARLEARLGARIHRASSVSGGDINAAFRLELEDGRCLFAKTNAKAPREMFAAEAQGLAWLGEALAVAVPQPVEVFEDALVLPWIESGARTAASDEALGRGLAQLHRHGAPCFGAPPLSREGERVCFIGPIRQDDAAHERWSDFYVEQRLRPRLDQALAAGQLGEPERRAFESIFSRMPQLAGPREAPARLHGDLWAGNAMVDAGAQPWIFDPAAYGGHREVDLAMMRLFGGFSTRVFDAYAEAFPLAAGFERRVPLWQLYPLLVHVCLFGGSYVGQLRACLAALR